MSAVCNLGESLPGGSHLGLPINGPFKVAAVSCRKEHPLTPSPHSHVVVLWRNRPRLAPWGGGKQAAVEQLWGVALLPPAWARPVACPTQRGGSNPLEGIWERASHLPLSDFHLLGLTLWRGAVLLCPHGADLQSSTGCGLPLLCVPAVGVLVALALLLRIWGGALLGAGVIAGCCFVPGGGVEQAGAGVLAQCHSAAVSACAGASWKTSCKGLVLLFSTQKPFLLTALSVTANGHCNYYGHSV